MVETLSVHKQKCLHFVRACRCKYRYLITI